MTALPKPERRRRRLLDEGEEVPAENTAVVARSSECESEDESPTIELSEYGSAVGDSADQEDGTEEGSETETEDGSETEETGSETEGYTDEEIAEERQSGDGEEQPENDKPDDDEDKKNPAYVPRKGAFYEHDFRRGDEAPEVEVTEEAKPKKKLWQDEGKWTHDKYIDNMQAPKSRQELIEIYGYDIRNADRPPEAPPRRQQRTQGPRTQQYIKDFMPRMAVIDTTEGGQDSIPNLDDDEFIQYKTSLNRINHGNKLQSTNPRRGRGRGNYRGSDIETKNSRNRPDSNRSSLDGYRNVEGPAEDNKNVDDFPSLGEMAKQGVPREVQSIKRSENNDRMLGDSKFNDRADKILQLEGPDSNRDELRANNRDKFQQTQDIRRQEDTRAKNRPQPGYRDERREVFSHGRGRDGGFNNQDQGDKWRAGANEFRDGYKADNYSKGDGYAGNDYGYNSRKQQHLVAGGNRGPKASNSGDAGRYFNNNKRGNRGYEPSLQQAGEITGAADNDVREYTNASNKYPDAKPKSRHVLSSSAVPMAGSGLGDDVDASNSKSLVISNKENVQTINVTITSTTTEKKSYAKERRAKGISRPVEGAVIMGASDLQAGSVVPVSSNPYQSLPPAGAHMDLTSAPLTAGANQFSSHRQQGGMFTETPLVGGAGAKLYNPSLPPPSFYQREHGGLPPGPHTPPALLPPAAALPFGLPVSSTGLALPPNAAGMPTNPALFQPPTGPPPSNPIAASSAMLAAQFLPAGMMYGGGPRVPPPGAPSAFPLALAYTSPPPQGTVTGAVVANQPPSQGAAPAQGIPASTQHKKVYRGDITYYAPELQQPSRTPQKRPKAAIPIIDPQEVPGQRVKEKSEQRHALEKSSVTTSRNSVGRMSSLDNKPTISGPVLTTTTDIIEGFSHSLDADQKSKGLYNVSAVSLQGVAAATNSSSVQYQTTPVACSSDLAEVTRESPANCSLSVNHTDSLKSSPSLDGSEPKRMAIKTELSPGGPPVNSSSSVTLSNKDTVQSVCSGMQNLQVGNGSIKSDVGCSAAVEEKQEACEKPSASSNSLNEIC